MNKKLKYLKAMNLLKSKEYKNFLQQFESTNLRPYSTIIEKEFDNLNLGINVEDVFDKCIVVYNTLNDKFTFQSLNNFYVSSEINTFNEENVQKIIEWLNEKLNEFSIDDIVMEIFQKY